MSDRPLRLAVVGHVNTGKTSLIATLARRDDLAIGDGRTTVGVQEIAFRTEGTPLLVLVDTPGFELAADMLRELDAIRGRPGARLDDVDALETHVREARASGRADVELDLRALEAALAADAILYVVDVTQAPLERLRDEVALLVRTARPVVAVMNFTAEAQTHEERWREVFRREKVHSQVAFDVMVADEASEHELFDTVRSVLPEAGRAALARLQSARRGQALRRRSAAVRAIAELLLDAAVLRVELPRGPGAEREAAERLRDAVRDRERHGLEAVARAHGFSGSELGEIGASPGAEVLRDDLFALETWRRSARALLGLAAGGAAAGVAVDAVLGGASLGLGALVGGAVGLAGGLARRGVHAWRRGDLVVARLDRAGCGLLLARAAACERSYRERTHARRDPVELSQRAPARGDRGRTAELLDLLERSADDPRMAGPDASPRRRAEALGTLERELAALLAPPPDAS